jgi:two-component system sensor histidine kinase QseC
MDEQIENLSATMISSNLTLQKLNQFEITDNQISEILGEDKINHIISIFDEDEVELYSNFTAQYLNLGFEKKQGFATEELSGHTVRILTLKTPEYILRIGVILDQTLDRWSKTNYRLIFYAFLILIIGLTFSYFMTIKLLKPLRDLTSYLLFLRNQVENNPTLLLSSPLASSPMLKEIYNNRGGDAKDEWGNLVETFERFLTSLKEYSENSALRVSLLTHEIKTPLTIIRNSVEKLEPHLKDSPEGLLATKKIEAELVHLTKFINDFLEWSLIINQMYTNTDLYAIKLEEKVLEIIAKFNDAEKSRIEFISCANSQTAIPNKVVLGQLDINNSPDKNSLLVFSQPWHLELLLNNIIGNAIKYSPVDQKIMVTLKYSVLSICDRGRGIPESVLAKVGKPFNFESSTQANRKGSGLGLAFVDLITKKYNWKFTIKSDSTGTTVEVSFPNDNEGADH